MSQRLSVEPSESDVFWAAVDLGTNTFRLLIAEEVSPGCLRQRELHQEVVRLGQGMESQGRLLPEAIERAEVLLRRFRERMDAAGARHRVGALTAAGRAAADGAVFCDRACRLLDGRVRILPGEEEARLSAAGALSLIDPSSRDVLFLDIGGGSTEVVSVQNGQAEVALSLPIGVVRLFESLGDVSPNGPPGSRLLSDLERTASRAIAALPEELSAGRWAGPLVDGSAFVLATAGTLLTVAAQTRGRSVFDTRALNGTTVTREALEGVWVLFARLSTAERRLLASVEPGREDVILGGLALLRAFLDRVGAPGFTVGDGGLLEGVLLDAVKEARGEAAWAV